MSNQPKKNQSGSRKPLQTIKEKESVLSSKDDFDKYFHNPNSIRDMDYEKKTKELYYSDQKNENNNKKSKIFNNLTPSMFDSLQNKNRNNYKIDDISDIYSQVSKTNTMNNNNTIDRDSQYQYEGERHLQKNNSSKQCKFNHLIKNLLKKFIILMRFQVMPIRNKDLTLHKAHFCKQKLQNKRAKIQITKILKIWLILLLSKQIQLEKKMIQMKCRG